MLTRNEHNDLHVIRDLRNAFAHDLRTKSFDGNKTNALESLKIWQTASSNNAAYLELFPGPRERLLYAAGMIAFRLQHRAKSPTKSGPVPEPDWLDDDAWPPVTSI